MEGLRKFFQKKPHNNENGKLSSYSFEDPKRIESTFTVFLPIHKFTQPNCCSFGLCRVHKLDNKSPGLDGWCAQHLKLYILSTLVLIFHLFSQSQKCQ